MIAQLFPESVFTVTATGDAEVPPLFPEEELCMRRAVEKRRREFAAGRACARKALEYLGIHQYRLLVGPNRAPVWPDAIVGSITHCEGFVGVAVARQGCIRGIGVDAERARPLPPNVIDLICLPREREWARGAAPPSYTNWPNVLFSAKEAVYKSLTHYCERPLGFHDVEITLRPRERRFAVRFAREAPFSPAEGVWLEGRFATTQTHVFTGVVLTTSPVTGRQSSHFGNGTLHDRQRPRRAR
jgi:enterobactin synthetase component D / holo-[acyl-carrier protein] synthase